jgi:hypothetical protein
MRHRCDSRIINYLTLMTFDTPEMTGTKSKFRLVFRFRLDSVPATGPKHVLKYLQVNYGLFSL